MANDVSSRQWRLDTPVPFGSAGAVVWPHNVYVKQAIWQGYAAQGNSLVLKDKNGKIWWNASGKSDLSDDSIRDVGWVEGVILDTLTAGVVIVHVK